MKLGYLLLIASLCAFAVSGCGTVASGVKYSELSPSAYHSLNVGKIVVYRPSRVTGSAARLDIVFNEANVGALRPLGFKIVEAPSGVVTIRTDTSSIDRPLELAVEKGSTIYLRTEFSNYVMTGAWDLIKWTRWRQSENCQVSESQSD